MSRQGCLIPQGVLPVGIGAPVQGDKLGGHGVAQGEVMVAWIEEAC